MPEEKNILSLTFDLSVIEVETSDDEGNSIMEEWYTITCGDSVCWRLIAEKDGGERQQKFVQLQIEHILTHLQEGLERRARKIGEESYFTAAKQLPYAVSGSWKQEGMEFFERRVQSYQNRARAILSIRRGRPQKLTKDEIATLPERYSSLHAKFKDIKKHHNNERKRIEQEKKRGLDNKEWMAQWLSVAKDHYPKESHAYLRQIADPDKYTSSPSKVAYQALASEKGYDPEYMEKLVRRARRATEAK